MNTLNIVCLIAITLKILMKLIFWLLIKNRRPKLFISSFFRIYSIYDMHDAPNNETLTFWKISNFCNIIMWIAIATLIVANVMGKWNID